MLKALLRPLWHRRHRLVHNTKSIFGWTFASLGTLPLPEKLKTTVTDISMLSIDHMVIHTNAYRNWHMQRSGTSRIQHLLRTDPADKDEVKKYHPTAPTKAMWDALIRNFSPAKEASLDVIMPVYRGYDQTLNALYTALDTMQHNATPYRIIVVNDCSPEPDLTLMLEELAGQGLFEYHANKDNLGFVKTVNFAMRLHESHDVLLLNSDTEVYNNWVDRIMAAAQSEPNISSVTPLSNNAEICSYPYFVQDNPIPLETDFAQIDRLAADINAGGTVEIPTGVGFCMFISRSSLNAAGYFDDVTFGKGYGEENDFCRKAVAKGFKHLLACDTYVRHIGGTSFAASKKKLVQRNYDRLLARYPNYTQIVHDFINADKVLPYRRNLDVARMKQHLFDINILMINHQMGGGTGRHVKEMVAHLQREDIGVVLMEPSLRTAGMLTLKHPALADTPNLTFSMEYDREALADTLHQLGVNHVHMHHWVNFPARTLDFLSQLIHDAGWGYDVTLHDYYTICPRINMVDKSGYYCGEPQLTACERCIEVSPSYAYGTPVWQWRTQFGTLLAHARKIFVPSDDMLERVPNYYHLPQLECRAHPERFDDAQPLSQPYIKGDVLRIGVIGAISDIKGSYVLVNAVKDAQKRNLPLEFVLIGHSDHPDINAGMEKLTVTGEYQERDMQGLLEQHKLHLIFISSIAPETYSYTLSVAWRYGIMPVVFDLGAPASRIRAITGKGGEILPYAYAKDATQLNNWFVNYEQTQLSPNKPDNVVYASYYSDYYSFEGASDEVAA
jgi:O-antigen biosynthesis protein